MDFTQQHHQATPLLLANVWDVTSASAAAEAGYTAIGTSSAAIAHSLGLDDGEALPFAELLYRVTRIRARVALPLSVDMEAGYGASAEEVVENLLALAHSGVVGVNLEDSVVNEGVRTLAAAQAFARRLQEIATGLAQAGVSLFINVRTDPFVLNHPQALAETISRGQLYAGHGADGLFVPCVTEAADIAAMVAAVALPLNVMAMPALPDHDQLAQLGVKRISMGNALHDAQQGHLYRLLKTVRQQRSFKEVFDHAGD
ncbi:2-methylisocitrate lyase-like PEP mutase family enzyme [Raoultella sp. BIGb0399]|uniref:isocitrate lyase/PEP mutase family protein n=1 Tax=Enterobacteriaceae TaxID=543 RepID=UPI000F4C79AF|nr:MULTISPECIES: isocitrate lyase/phosphoenolpyruvate mutase family protein [Enterobacteriaceae]QNK06814.1 isocitrate lyase/phosphoenolpyruvate mutase family protein [Enterobacter sp. JUb54]ROS09902.1 2-methylisocitrate lyase-like PEP mutase family enzyme [Raoultella sp. BIGb0399]